MVKCTKNTNDPEFGEKLVKHGYRDLGLRNNWKRKDEPEAYLKAMSRNLKFFEYDVSECRYKQNHVICYCPAAKIFYHIDMSEEMRQKMIRSRKKTQSRTIETYIDEIVELLNDLRNEDRLDYDAYNRLFNAIENIPLTTYRKTNKKIK